MKLFAMDHAVHQTAGVVVIKENSNISAPKTKRRLLVKHKQWHHFQIRKVDEFNYLAEPRRIESDVPALRSKCLMLCLEILGWHMQSA